MRKADDRLWAVSADSLAHADLIFTVSLNDADSIRRNLDCILFTRFPDGKGFGCFYGSQVNGADDFSLVNNLGNALAASFPVHYSPYSEKTDAEEHKQEERTDFFMLFQEIT